MLLVGGKVIEMILSMENPEEVTNMCNSYLKELPYRLAYKEHTISIVGSDGQMVSRVALLPTDAMECIHNDGSIQSSLSATCFVNGLWLSHITLSGSLKRFDDFYKSWGLHKFPLLTAKEEKVSKKFFTSRT